MRYSFNPGRVRMSTKREIQFLQSILKFFSKFKLVNFRFNEDKGTLETVKRKTIVPLSLLVVVLHLTNISLSVWGMQTSTTQFKVLSLFQIIISLASISLRCTLVKYDSEIISLVNNIVKLNYILGL